MIARAPRAVTLLGLFFAAGAYFSLAVPLGIELIDEGQIYYPSWAVAEGAIPYRDFRHLYGPALFFVNGAVLRWFGEDVLSIRLSVVVLKSAIGVVLYLLARRVASIPFALLAWGCFVAAWGSPLVFNGPYANHYALAACSLAILLYLSFQTRFRLACALAGLCFGVAGTFKQTSGVFGLLSFLLFLLVVPNPTATAVDSRETSPIPPWLARGLGVAIPCATIALLLFYIWTHAGSPLVVLLIAPAMFLSAMALAGGSNTNPETRERSAVGIACAVSGAALLPAIVGSFFAAQGLLGEVTSNLFVGLPSVMRPYVFYPLPDARALVGFAAVAASFVVARVGGRRLDVALVAAGAAAAVLFALPGDVAGPGSPLRAFGDDLRRYFLGRGWIFDVARLCFLVPFTTLAFTGAVLFRARRRGASHSSNASRADEPSRLAALRLIACQAAIAPVYLYPASDIWHVVMSLPYYLPLIAHLFERYVRAARSRLAPVVVVAATCLLLVAPSVQLLLDGRLYPSAKRLSRATRITGMEPWFGQLTELVDALERREPRGEPMLVTSGEQMLYFLAGRRSIVEHDEFILYLVTMNHISPEDARRLVDQRRIAERLADRRPLIVARDGSSGSKRFRLFFPDLAAYVDAHYRTVAAIGPYRVLEFHG